MIIESGFRAVVFVLDSNSLNAHVDVTTLEREELI